MSAYFVFTNSQSCSVKSTQLEYWWFAQSIWISFDMKQTWMEKLPLELNMFWDNPAPDLRNVGEIW